MNDLFPKVNTDNFQSKEERYFYWFLVDLYNEGYVSNVLYEPFTYDLSEPITKPYVVKEQLKTKVKITKGEETIQKGLVYTPDFVVHFTRKALGVFVETLNTEDKLMKGQSQTKFIGTERGFDIISVFEVKPDFDQNNMTRYTKVKMNWLCQREQIFVNLVKVPSIFKKYFVPSRYLITDKSAKLRKIDFNVRKLEQFVSEVSK
tara:strand:+ start:8375 stop:8986 length:612 start_codon:yes stop_codon:yes gene_type:complete